MISPRRQHSSRQTKQMRKHSADISSIFLSKWVFVEYLFHISGYRANASNIARNGVFIGRQSQIMITGLALPLCSIKPIYIENRGESSQMVPWVVNLKHHRWCHTPPSEGYVLGTLVFVCHWTLVDRTVG